MNPIRIDYYSDVLCIWAYIAQARIQELQQEFGDKVELHYRYLSVFGDTRGRLDQGWHERGGVAGYADHVLAVARDFPEIEVNDTIWRSCAPRSSAPAHLWLCAARQISREHEDRLATAIRAAFFCDVMDVGREVTLAEIADGAGLDTPALEEQIQSGAAWAALCADLQSAHAAQIQASPTLLFNEGRQQLTGNVGYRIIKANLTELMGRPAAQYSWC